MKFSEQVASYQRKLTRRSRFFSTLMMASGIGLAAAAPFLSYEVSKIECQEIGTVSTQDNSGEVSDLKLELAEKDQLVSQLEQELDRKNEEIDKLGDRPDCEAVVEVITNERDRLNERVIYLVAEAEEKENSLNECIEQLERCKTQEDPETTPQTDCTEYTEIINRLEVELSRCQRGLNLCRERLAACENQEDPEAPQQADCTKYTAEITRLRELLAAKDDQIKELAGNQGTTIACPEVRLAGSFHPEEVFIFNDSQFKIKFNPDDVGDRFFFYHDNRDVTSRIKSINIRRYYSFRDSNGNGYRINFGRVLENSVRFSLAPG